MKTLKIISLFVLLYLFVVGCKDESDDGPFVHRIVLEAVPIECDYLDTIFSDLNNILIDKYNKNNKSYYVIINSKEELDEINPFDFDVNCIDFSKYILIGGIIFDADYCIESIVLDMERRVYLSIHLCWEPFTQPIDLYYWRLFPKIFENKLEKVDDVIITR